MKSGHVFYTKTLGDLFLEQGYYPDAKMAFQALLEKEPGREDYMSALALCEKNMKAQGAEEKNDLAGLVKCWVRLLREEGRR